MEGDSGYIAHRRSNRRPLTIAVDLEDGTIIVIVVKNTGEVGLMALDTNTDETIEDLHIVGKYDKDGDFAVESLGVMHLEVAAMIHELATGAELDVVYEEEDE